MTREEAITRLHWLKRELIKGTDMNEPIDMAIEALNNVTESANDVVEQGNDAVDLISRQKLIDAHYEWCNKHPNHSFPTWSLRLMKDAPSASARPMGRWVESIAGNGWNEWNVYTCSNCGYIPTGEGKQYWNFCPNCGADMIGEDHEGNT